MGRSAPEGCVPDNWRVAPSAPEVNDTVGKLQAGYKTIRQRRRSATSAPSPAPPPILAPLVFGGGGRLKPVGFQEISSSSGVKTASPALRGRPGGGVLGAPK